MQSIKNQIDAVISMGLISVEPQPFILQNLNPKFQLRDYQKEALARFNFYLDNEKIKIKPTQLLFHMATGSGKTLVMASVILSLYERGYRNFIFFVNSNSIIQKTRDNFLNSASSKYLFADNISILGQRVKINEVEHFQFKNHQDINILFTTIQGLHTKLNFLRENSITFSDFENKKIVLLSDEAHHINALTKKGKLTKDEADELVSWEGTVNRIFKMNAENLLLEFTATADLQHPEIAKKYNDKLLFDYSLKQFRKDLYSKEVQVLQADLPPFERALQAVVLSQYRRKIFESFSLNIKPVILFKSKTIEESEGFYKEFLEKLKQLRVETLKEIEKKSADSVIDSVFEYLRNQKISLEGFLLELKEDFASEKCLSVNSKNDTESKQLLLNSLEDKTNEIRAIFAVDKLNEGWDVLNLFDIVRLYNTRDADHKSGKIGKTTMSEAQLIGRGARYCPFKISEGQDVFQRKFDDDLTHPLRIGEELYYHSAHNPKYISELNKALEETGIKAPQLIKKRLYLKPEFKKSPLFEQGYIYLNDKVENDRKDVMQLPESIRNKVYRKELFSGYSSQNNIFENEVRLTISRAVRIYSLAKFPENVLRKALNKLPFFKFSNLKVYFPHLQSVSEFITCERYLGKIKVEVSGNTAQVDNLHQEQMLAVAVSVLDEISKAIYNNRTDVVGSKEFKPRKISDIFRDKILNINISEDKEKGMGQCETFNTDLFLDLSKEEWYVFNENFGTSEEKFLVKYIKQVYDILSKNYAKIYLIRNENHFKIYNFEDGRAFMPDFVLFLESSGNKKLLQVFIEPKGAHLLSADQWKEDFLINISIASKAGKIFEDGEISIIGLPFFSEKDKKSFQKAFESEIVNLKS